VLDWQDKKNCISKAFAAQKRSKKTGFIVTYYCYKVLKENTNCCAIVVTYLHGHCQLCGLRTTIKAF